MAWLKLLGIHEVGWKGLLEQSCGWCFERGFSHDLVKRRWEDILDRNNVSGFRDRFRVQSKDLQWYVSTDSRVVVLTQWGSITKCLAHKTRNIASHADRGCLCSAQSPHPDVGMFWILSDAIQYFFFRSPHPPHLKTFLFKGVTLPSSGPQGNF